MNIHSHSPNPRLSSNNLSYKHSSNTKNYFSENFCQTNYPPPNQNIYLKTENYNKEDNKARIRYLLNSKNFSNPIKSLGHDQNIIYQNESPELTFFKPNSNYLISKNNSTNFLNKIKTYDDEGENNRNNYNKKNELFGKIRYLLNRIDKTINLYKDNNINKDRHNKFNNLSLKNKYLNRNSLNTSRKNINLKINENNIHNKKIKYILDNFDNNTMNNNLEVDEKFQVKIHFPDNNNSENFFYRRTMTDKYNSKINNSFSEKNKNININKKIHRFYTNNNNYKERINDKIENCNENKCGIKRIQNNIEKNENNNINYEELIKNENDENNINCYNRRSYYYQGLKYKSENKRKDYNKMNSKKKSNDFVDNMDNDYIPLNTVNNIFNKDSQIKKLSEKLNIKKINSFIQENRYKELCEENEFLKKELDICAQEKLNYESHLSCLEQKLNCCCHLNHELECKNAELLSEIKSYKINNKNNLSTKENNNLSKLDELNGAFTETKKEYDQLKQKVLDFEKINEGLRKLIEDNNIKINDLTKNNDIYKRKIDNLNYRINILNSEKNKAIKNCNNLNFLYKELTKEKNKLEKKLKDDEEKLTNIKGEEEINNNILNPSNKKDSNNNNNKIYNKNFYNMQNQIKKLREENNNLKEELKSLRNKSINKAKSSEYEDEIVIVKKETTYSTRLFEEPNEFNIYGLINNKYEIKKNADITSDKILKYHEIIQDLSNMILIYEKFFFKGKVKPKNNNELFCYLIVRYIYEKFKKIKWKTFLNMLYYREKIENK